MPENHRTSETFDLARLIYDDARSMIQDGPNFADMLDLSFAGLEFERATGDGFAARDTFFEAIDLLRHYRDLPPWLYGGAAHAAWTAVQVSHSTGLPIRGLDGLDDMILGWIVDFPAREAVDLPSGLLGLGVYALGHPNADVAEKMTAETVRAIERRVEHDDDGIFIRVAATDFREIMKPHSIGQRDLGMAHGNAGLVAYLSRVTVSGLDSAGEAARLLRPALSWLMRQRSELGDALFPHTVESRYEPSRSAWCYGDPGVSLALAAAATATGSGEADAMAREAAAVVIARPSNRAKVVDSGLCHGAAGLCWYGRRAAQQWDLPGADRLSAYWVDYVRYERAQGPLHYLTAEGVTRRPSFLDGDLGVALALLQESTGQPAAWEDRLLGGPVTRASR
ncbi:lanthionine synthetase LanC family protein [Micromonospora profundi]|uniref:lanthionine synthetase LanC family protein n=1 Tax=Micromonospora TaxID=1873 RepID=UPI0033BE83CA